MRVRLLPCLATVLMGLALAAPASADQVAHSGSLPGGCTYNANADTDDSTFSLTVDCPQKAVSATVNGVYDSGGATLDTLDYTVFGVPGTVDVNYRLDLPQDAQDAEALFRDIAQNVGQIATTTAATRTAPHNPDSQNAAANGADALLAKFEDYCRTLTFPAKDAHCPKPENSDPTDATIKELPTGGAQGSQADQQQQEACPEIQTALPKIFVVCLPLYVGGDAQVPDDKDLVVIPGGALIAVPVGSSLDAPTTPYLHTKGAIVLAGGPVGGVNLRMEAGKDVAMAGSVISMIGNLRIDAADVTLGRIETSRVLAALPPDISSWATTGLIGDLAAGRTIDQPGLVFASSADINVSGTAHVLKDSAISASGFGIGGGVADVQDGQVPPRGTTIGASNDYGGSHGGVGGYDDSLDPVGPGTTYGNPFDPDAAGSGGAGSHVGGVNGSSGGGVLKLTIGTLTLDGSVRANGDDVSQGNFTYASGGGGAGGSISARLGKLTGKGDLSADGGNFTSGGLNEGAGAGGGGRIAVRYADRKAFAGKVHAHGGRDQVSILPATCAPHIGAGGAGTLYWLRTGGGKRGPGDDQLVVDGGGGTAFPPPSGTPVSSSWGGKKRELLVTGRGQVWARKLSFAAITLRGGSVITTQPGDERADGQVPTAPADRTLTLKAGTLDVDSTSRVDVTGRGYAGGGQTDETQTDGEGPSGHPTTGGNGGSHGGRGGQPSNSATGPAAAPYDGATHPKQPGAGGSVFNSSPGTAGGGVLLVTADKLILNGALAADGESGTGPTKTDATPDQQDEGGMGAGGSIQVKAKELRGRGPIHADGGSLCLKASEVLTGVRTCNDEGGGGGGGGRVLVAARKHSGYKGHGSARGGANHGNPSSVAKGRNGTVMGIR